MITFTDKTYALNNAAKEYIKEEEPSAGEPGLKNVTIKAYWGNPGETIHFVVDMKESLDVYHEASKKAKEAAASAGADPSMAVYEMISIEDAV